MATTLASLIGQHPTNPIKDTYKQSDSSKPWAKSYPPISRLKVHTSVRGPDSVVANFDAFLDEYDDESLRLGESGYPSNHRKWRLDTEADGIQWFHTEISNIVLGAFANYPTVLQASHEKALSDTRTDQTVDISYSVSQGKERMPLIIGEFKRGLLRRDQWQSGKIEAAQQSVLSRELRGYAHKYNCPHIFCFDNYSFLMLQFRARDKHDIKDAKCEVDCWIFPRQNSQGTPLRYALYRLLVQGFRRCQGLRALDVSLYSVRPSRRNFYNGQPAWKLEDGKSHVSPWGHTRKVDQTYGAFSWTDTDGSTPLLDQNGAPVWDTKAFWESGQGQTDTIVEEDIYGPD
ncbi:hypothetical protein NCS52_01557900 [Fusarium sp. LHS14.1]|nr:hypothetical protein NCS52_01557900 [Fusarium sp. LHS14.1]